MKQELIKKIKRVDSLTFHALIMSCMSSGADIDECAENCVDSVLIDHPGHTLGEYEDLCLEYIMLTDLGFDKEKPGDTIGD